MRRSCLASAAMQSRGDLLVRHAANSMQRASPQARESLLSAMDLHRSWIRPSHCVCNRVESETVYALHGAAPHPPTQLPDDAVSVVSPPAPHHHPPSGNEPKRLSHADARRYCQKLVQGHRARDAQDDGQSEACCAGRGYPGLNSGGVETHLCYCAAADAVCRQKRLLTEEGVGQQGRWSMGVGARMCSERDEIDLRLRQGRERRGGTE